MNVLSGVRFVVGIALVTATTAVALADDIAPPPYRGLPHSVQAKFDLFGAPVPGGPSVYNTVGGVYPLDPLQPFVAQPITDPTNNALIYPIALPNFIDPLPLKKIRIQYSWFGALPGTGPPGDAAAVGVLPSPGGVVQLVNSTPPQLIGGNVYHRWDDYEIIPNPDSERFEIAFFDADPRWVIIDTISMPEPTSATMAVILAVFAGACRRR